MTAPQRPPRDAIRLPGELEGDYVRRLSVGVDDWQALMSEVQQIWPWIRANGFPYWIPVDEDLYLSRDGRVLYGERFLWRPNAPTPIRSWDWRLTPDKTDLRRRTFAYPIVRPLAQYAPELAQRLGLTKETR